MTENERNDLERINKMRKMLEDMGASEEDILKIWSIALEAADKIVKEAE